MTEPKIAPCMVDGVGYCSSDCPQNDESSVGADCLETGWGDICPVWAQRLAAWADEAREWAVSWAHHHPHLVPEKLLSRYPGGNDQSQDGNGGG